MIRGRKGGEGTGMVRKLGSGGLMGRKRILVVDDDEGARLTTRRLLEFSGIDDFEVVEAANGRLAAEAVREGEVFDLVLMDIEMPEMDGFVACREIRQVDSSVPIVFVTAHATVDYRRRGREAGGDSFLAKPVKKAPLLSLVTMFSSASRHR